MSVFELFLHALYGSEHARHLNVWPQLLLAKIFFTLKKYLGGALHGSEHAGHLNVRP